MSDIFTVGVSVAPVRGGGRLTVEPGEIVLETDRLTRGLSHVAGIVHTERRVMLVKARLVPPWFNTAVLLHDDEANACAVTGIWARNRLRASLQAAGFDVDEVTTWFSLDAPTGASEAPRSSDMSGAFRLCLVLLIIAAAAIAILVVGHSPLFAAFTAICVVLSVVALLRPRNNTRRDRA